MLHKQARDIMHHVYHYFKHRAEPGTRVCSSVVKCQEAAVDVCGEGSNTVQQISNEANALILAQTILSA